MCVIMLVVDKNKRPNDVMIEKAWLQNPDLGGVAWKEKNKAGKTVVRWKKGLIEEEWADLVKTLPAPFVAHARIASADGGGVSEELTHPFPVDEHVSLALEGTTSRGVLFHNGNWKEWSAEARMALYTKGAQLPAGRWNDTRTMAWLTYLYGDGFMELLPSQRGILFKPDSWEIFAGPGWKEINGVWCSNDLFIHRQRNQNTTPTNAMTIRQNFGGGSGGFCLVASCQRRDIDKTGFCQTHALPVPGAHSPVILAPDGKVVGPSEVSTASPTPFRTAATRILHNRTLIEEWYTKEWMSKNLYKQVMLVHDWIEEPEGSKRREKGLRILEVICKNPNLEQRMRVE